KEIHRILQSSSKLLKNKDMDRQSWHGQDSRTNALEKIDTIISDHTDDKITSIPEESVIRSYALLPEVDTEIIPK
ncbi:8672_t:CDS:2, partial [Diversispora eburnea]